MYEKWNQNNIEKKSLRKTKAFEKHWNEGANWNICLHEVHDPGWKVEYSNSLPFQKHSQDPQKLLGCRALQEQLSAFCLLCLRDLSTSLVFSKFLNRKISEIFLLTHFRPRFPILYPLKTDNLIFSGGTEKDVLQLLRSINIHWRF